MAARQGDNARHMGNAGEQTGRGINDLLASRGLVGHETLLKQGQLRGLQRLDCQQAIDKQTIAAHRGHATGRGMRRLQKSLFFQIEQGIANRRGTEIQSAFPGNGTRPDRLTFTDEAVDQSFQNDPGPFAQGMRCCR